MTDDLPNPALLPAGLADLLPPDAEREADLVEAMMVVFAGHGYERLKPPLLEFEDSLLAGSGAAVAEQTFRLMDPVSQRMMGLRADTTPQVARIAATRLSGQARPLRLCYAGQVLRVRGTQLAPSRQLPQAGVELIGGAAPAADAEVAVVAIEALAVVGVTAVSLDVTLPTMVPALMEAAGAGPALRSGLAHALDRKDSAAVAALVQRQPGPLAVLPELMASTGPADGALAALDAADLPPAARAIAQNAASVLLAIQARAPGLRITLDPVEFRGFRYHTGVAFTIYGPGMSGELARGGRYLSQNDEPATGMTLYPDAVMRAAPGSAPRPRLFLPIGADGAPFRARGFATVAALATEDTPQRLRCTHELKGGEAVPILPKD
ncbi:ATP phosphoribosyltransferase regulatory subunit [Roseomonas terrae]|jgi:ATP phosphoribosyltransferase regulatory subunit|uniref:ATP phosphoribosyltransferase regulatory subunit n=1 Tax=Neoroseomonas terrae TaxID=424799 RepID=A0ABS5EG93_9PROT|nr:ATP phosphoribosyltransferase regulatory subunit [Neoroseomonas terrae]MBR0650049.1 ATP phosphoribosyltransferase regulatory subunit [Neoroseomonas terrae]